LLNYLTEAIFGLILSLVPLPSYTAIKSAFINKGDPNGSKNNK
jgi:hypothetical protein